MIPKWTVLVFLSNLGSIQVSARFFLESQKEFVNGIGMPHAGFGHFTVRAQSHAITVSPFAIDGTDALAAVFADLPMTAQNGADVLMQLLVCYAFVLIFDDVVRMIWGPEFRSMGMPAAFQVMPLFIAGGVVPPYYLLLIGVALFSGDLALRAYAGHRLFPMAAPTGGMVMIAGWALLALAAFISLR